MRFVETGRSCCLQIPQKIYVISFRGKRSSCPCHGLLQDEMALIILLNTCLALSGGSTETLIRL